MSRLTWVRFSLLTLIVCLAGAPAVSAQDPAAVEYPQPPAESQQQYEAPAHVSFVDGTAVLERDGRPDESPANMPLLAGDRLRTRDGRLEVLFTDGSTLHLDAHTTVDFQSDELIRLLEGRIRLSIPGPSRAVAYRIDTQSGWAQIFEPGEYRVTLSNGRNGEMELAVLRGEAEIGSEGGRTALRAGERAYARTGTAPSYAYVFNSASWDAFDRWSETRRSQRLGASAQYLPDEVQPYAATLDRYGTWQRDASYGYVWYPRVDVGWRPYYRGRWITLPTYGWTWVGHDHWSWPTHHYGRWGFSAGAWFWIPGRSWGPAWVAWAHAPGYVSWSPLGWNNRPLIQINVFTGRNRWHPWTIVPRHHFGVGFVHTRALSVLHIDAGVRRSFRYRNSAPEYRPFDRVRPPIRVAGTRSVAVPRTGTAVPRDGRRGAAPIYTNIDRDRGRAAGDGRRIMVGPGGSASPPRSTAASPGRSTAGRPAGNDNRPRAVPRGSAPSAAPPAGRGAVRQRYEPSRPGLTRMPDTRQTAPSNAGPSRSRTAPPASRPDDRGSARPRAVPRGGSGQRATPPSSRGSSGRAPAAGSPSASGSPSYSRPRPSVTSRPPANWRGPSASRPPSASEAPSRSRRPSVSRLPSNAAPSAGAPRGRRAPEAAPSRSPSRAVPRGGAARPAPSRPSAPSAAPSRGGQGRSIARPSGPAGGGPAAGGSRSRSRSSAPPSGRATARPRGGGV